MWLSNCKYDLFVKLSRSVSLGLSHLECPSCGVQTLRFPKRCFEGESCPGGVTWGLEQAPLLEPRLASKQVYSTLDKFSPGLWTRRPFRDSDPRRLQSWIKSARPFIAFDQRSASKIGALLKNFVTRLQFDATTFWGQAIKFWAGNECAVFVLELGVFQAQLDAQIPDSSPEPAAYGACPCGRATSWQSTVPK